ALNSVRGEVVPLDAGGESAYLVGRAGPPRGLVVAECRWRREERFAGELGEPLDGGANRARDDVVAQGAAIETGVEIVLEGEAGAERILVEHEVAAFVVHAHVD